MDVPGIDELRARSTLLTTKFPDPAGDVALTALTAEASGLVAMLTGRAIGFTGEGPFGCPLEDVPAPLVPLATRAIRLRAERMDLMEGDAAALIARAEIALGGLASFTAGPYCVPMDTEALTDRGWRSYGDLCEGDMVLGFDPETETTRWTPILEIVAPVEAEVVRFGNSRWSMRCTPNHRWVTRDRFMADGEYMEGPWHLRMVDQLRGKRKYDVLTAAPAETERQLDITPAEAALIAWLWTDGHIEMPKPSPAKRLVGASPRGAITQKKYRREVEATLALVDAPYSVRPHGDDGCVRYKLSAPWFGELYERAGLWRFSPVEFVLKLDAEQREAFLEAGILAEGSRTGSLKTTTRGPAKRGSWFGRFYRWAFSQNEGPVLDAFALASQLSGYGTRVKGDGRRRIVGGSGFPNKGTGRDFLFARPFQGGQKMTVEPDGRELVWCVRTELGTWTIRQGETISLTGNSESYFPPGQTVTTLKALDSDPEMAAELWALATECVREGWMRLWYPDLIGALEPASATQEFDWMSLDGGYPPEY